MSLRHLNARQLRLVCRYTLRHSLRSGSALVFLLLALFFGLTAANAIISPFEAAVAQNEQLGIVPDAAAVERTLASAGLTRAAVEWVISPRASGDPEAQRAAEERTRLWVDYLLNDRPALLSAILLILVFGTPLLIPFGAFNQTAGDIGNRGLRYLLLRTERANIYYGRLIATAGFTILVQAVVVLSIGLYLWLKVGVYAGIDVATWSTRGYLALVLVSLPYVALCAWISTTRDSPMASLTVCTAIVGAVPLGALLAGFAWPPAANLVYVLPWALQNQLLAPSPGRVLAVAGACLLYTVVFTWLGARTFEKRDL
jgi:ABC-type Na+ efflux pump permease subunit